MFFSSVAPLYRPAMTAQIPRILPFGDAAITEAAALILAGGIVAVPTETVYGLAADATNADAVARIVIRSLAPDLELPGILRRSFSQEELAELSLEMVAKAAGRILDMTQGLAPRRDPYVSKRERELQAAMAARR